MLLKSINAVLSHLYITQPLHCTWRVDKAKSMRTIHKQVLLRETNLVCWNKESCKRVKKNFMSVITLWNIRFRRRNVFRMNFEETHLPPRSHCTVCCWFASERILFVLHQIVHVLDSRICHPCDTLQWT